MIRGFPNGETQLCVEHNCSARKGIERIPGEVKHFSTRRKRKSNFYSLSSGERKGKSLERILLKNAQLKRERRSKIFISKENFKRGRKMVTLGATPKECNK